MEDKKESCLVCFDMFDEEKPKCINLVECECKFNIHGECWMNWMNFKRNILECPICHKYIEDTQNNTVNLDDNQDEENNQLVEVHDFNFDIEHHRTFKYRVIIALCKFLFIIYTIYLCLWIFL